MMYMMTADVYTLAHIHTQIQERKLIMPRKYPIKCGFIVDSYYLIRKVQTGFPLKAAAA
jgi:hypothetical protein